MSAYMVDKTHIDVLISGAIRGPYKDGMPMCNTAATINRMQARVEGPSMRKDYVEVWWDTADRVGQMLVDENVRSLRARYEDCDNMIGWALEPYEFVETAARFDIPQLAMAVSGYSYQACEHEDYDQSDAKWFVDEYRQFLLDAVPGNRENAWAWTAESVRELAEKQGPRPVSLMDIMRGQA